MKLSNVTITGFIAISIFAGCKTNEKSRQSSSVKSENAGSLSVQGTSAQALFELIKAAQVAAETIDGHVIRGATTFQVDTIHCTTIMDANQTKNCVVSKAGKNVDINQQIIAANAVDSLDQLGARVDADLIGALNYEIKNVTCTRPVVRNPIVTCYFDKRSEVTPIALNADESDTIFDALSLAGVKPETVDGQIIVGSTTLKADQMYCSILSDANHTRTCGIAVKGQIIDVTNTDSVYKLIDLLSSIGAAVHPELIGAANYEVNQVECSKVVYPGARATCTLKLSK